MVLDNKLLPDLRAGIKQLYKVLVPLEKFVLQPTPQAFEGTHTLVLFPLVPYVKQTPDQVGEALGGWLCQHINYIARYRVIQGFLNISLTDATWLTAVQAYCGIPAAVSKPQKIILEIACPNTNKPLHLGHLRNTFIGDAVANMLQAVGHKVKKLMHVNDRGIHICKSMWAYQQDGNPKTPDSAGVKGDHLVGDYYVAFEQRYQQQVAALSKKLGSTIEAKQKAPAMLAIQRLLQQWEAGDNATIALWKKMNRWVRKGFDETYRQIGITFDKVYCESDTYLLGKAIVQEGLDKGVFYKKEDNSVWVDLEAEGLGHKLLLRGDGTAVYITQDLGTADLRERDFAADKAIYVVGDEQDYHFSVLFATLKKLERPYAHALYHLSYGMVNLPTGKMKSREGTTVDADKLIADMVAITTAQTKILGKVSHFSQEEAEKLYHTLAVGALKFFLLKVNPKKSILFDPQSAIDLRGNTGPFIQYTHARICSLLQKAKIHNLSYHDPVASQGTLCATEQQLIAAIIASPTLLSEAAITLNPAIVAEHLYALAKAYNQCYSQLPILQAHSDQERCKRLYLSYCTAQTLRQLADLLGLDLPFRM